MVSSNCFKANRWLLLPLLLLVGCAPQPKVFKAEPEKARKAVVWPAPPEKARYRYVGQLTGEANFVATRNGKDSTASRAFNWLVGLSPDTVLEQDVLQRPQSGMVDAEGRVYVTDTSRQAVYIFDKTAGKLQVFDIAADNVKFRTPVGIAAGRQGGVLVADAELRAVYLLARSGKPLGVIGRGQLKRPTGLARDAQRGLIYVADTYAHDIKVFADDGKLIRTIGKRGTAEGEFNYPTYLTFKKDKLYVTDSMNARIQVLDSAGQVVNVIGKRGLYVGDLVRPKGVALDSLDNVYVVESLYDNLLVFDNTGRTLMAIGGTGKEVGKFYLPAGVWTDDKDQVYVADMFNGRVLVLQFLGAD